VDPRRTIITKVSYHKVESLGTIASTPQQYWGLVIKGRVIWHDKNASAVPGGRIYMIQYGSGPQVPVTQFKLGRRAETLSTS
jgi:hypothetical protein